jgi:hypothetical protein
VGAGDAFLAALLMSRLRGESPQAGLEAGCRLGARVAGKLYAEMEFTVHLSLSARPAYILLMMAGHFSRHCAGTPGATPSHETLIALGHEEQAGEAGVSCLCLGAVEGAAV